MVVVSKRRPKCPIHGCDFTQKSSRFGMFWSCPKFPNCDQMAKRSKQDGMWRTSDQAARSARIKAHEKFDGLWKNGKVPRGACYRILSDLMRMASDKCHIEHFDVEYCQKVIEFVENGTIVHERAKHLALTEPKP